MAKRLLQTRSKLQANKDKVSKQNVRDKEHVIIHGVTHMLADTTMNGILYPREEVEKLADSLANQRIVMPANHPEGENGEFISATDPWALASNHIGAYAYNFTMQGDKLISDVAINPETAMLNSYGETIMTAINEQLPMDMSTGFYLNIEDEEGYGKDGEPYTGIASNLLMDHSAFLPDVVGAKNKSEGVGLHTNSAKSRNGETIDTDVAELTNNMATPAMKLPLAPDGHQWNEAQAIERIKQYTNSTSEPSTSYRKFFLEFNQDAVNDFASYSKPFADIIDGVPHAVLEPLANSESEYATNYRKRFANSGKEPLLNRLYTWCKKMGYNESTQTKDDGDRIMLDKMKALLNAANIETDGLNEDAILAAYNKHITANAQATAANNNAITIDDVTAAVNAAVKPLQEQLQANSDKELDKAVGAVVALNKGIDETAAKAMGLDACNAFLAANGKVAFNAHASTPDAAANCQSLELPNAEA